MFTNKQNYQPWNIKIQDFPKNKGMEEQIKFLVGFAILAPSGHNSQPWKFKINKNSLEIFTEFSRSLPKSDPLGKQLCISLGCLLENFCIAADFYDFETIVNFTGNITGNFPMIKILLKKNITSKDKTNHLINFITKRVTNRSPYQTNSLPENFINKINSLSSDKYKIFITQDPILKNKLINNVISAQIKTMRRNEFRQELSELMKPNYTKSKIGMPGFVFDIPLPLSILSSLMVKYINMSILNKKVDINILKKTPAFITITSLENSKSAWLESGRLFERIWLLAVSEGLSCAPNAAPIAEQENTKVHQNILNTNLFLQVFTRVGVADKITSHTPRLKPQEVII